MNVATTTDLTLWTRLELHAPDGSLLATGWAAHLLKYGDDLGWPNGLYVRVPDGRVTGRIVSALLDGCTYAVDGPALPLVAVALLARGRRVTFGVQPDTCACGQWPVEEYGERCPSCPLADAEETENALRLGTDKTSKLRQN